VSDDKPSEKPVDKGKPPPSDPSPGDQPKAGGNDAKSEGSEGKVNEKEKEKEKEAARERERDQALNRLHEDATELSNGRFGKIVDQELGRLRNVTNLNVFQGDFTVDGDFVAGGRGRAAAGGRARIKIDQAVLGLLDEHYVQPTGFQVGVDLLYQTNLAIFSGPARTGRRSRALASLTAVLQRVDPQFEIFELGGNVLGNMAWRAPNQRCGLLVVDQPHGNAKPAAESIDDEWLSAVSGQLAERGSYLAVVTAPVHGALTTEFVLEDMELPDPLEIVRKRILNALPWLSEEDISQRLNDTELANIFLERDDPRFAAKAAGAIVEALRNDDDLGPAIARLHDPVDEVREWLGTDPDHAEIAFTLATAVLEGSSYLNVADAAMALYRKIGGAHSGSLTPRYLRGLMADRGWIEYTQPPDPDSPAVVRFRRERLRQVVLTRIWFELDGLRAKVLHWLTTLAGHADVEVRARVAVAAGALATKDFEHGLYTYLQPWGNTDSAILRQSAAQGLNVAGRVSGHTDIVWKHVERWADLVQYKDSAKRLPATAALTAGGLGVDSPRRALRVLRTLVVCEGNWDLLPSAAASAHQLLEAGQVEEILEAFLEWTEPTEQDEAVIKALAVFIFVAQAEGSADDAVSDRPVMLPSTWNHRDKLAELWSRALSREALRKSALGAVRTWIRAADKDPEVHDVVLYMLDGIAERGDQDFQRLQHALQEWADDQDDPSDAADAFYHELVDEPEGLTA
jgi:hypothetical protein